MKKINFKKLVRYSGLLMLLLAFSASLTSCVVHTPSHRQHRSAKVPPGHAKKYYGDRSAKRYAPGQQKKKQHGKPVKGHGMKKNNHKRGR